MDVSNREKPTDPAGEELIATVVSLTGLPASLVEKELDEIVSSAGHAPESLTLDELRAAMLAYLETFRDDANQAEASQDASKSVQVE